jgi:hypothetical protein
MFITSNSPAKAEARVAAKPAAQCADPKEAYAGTTESEDPAAHLADYAKRFRQLTDVSNFDNPSHLAVAPEASLCIDLRCSEGDGEHWVSSGSWDARNEKNGVAMHVSEMDLHLMESHGVAPENLAELEQFFAP